MGSLRSFVAVSMAVFGVEDSSPDSGALELKKMPLGETGGLTTVMAVFIQQIPNGGAGC